MSKNGIVYDYKDGIYDNRINQETFIRWSGQLNNKSSDKLVLDRSNIHIWNREKGKNFKYLGKVKEKLVFQKRDSVDKKVLILDLFLESNISKYNTLQIGTIAPIYDYKKNSNDHLFMKFKMECFNLLNLKPKGNWCCGIMEGEEI